MDNLHKVTLMLTAEQQAAIQELFKQRNWTFVNVESGKPII